MKWRNADLFEAGKERIQKFCLINDIPCPKVQAVRLDNWMFDACAYYREKVGIRICLEKCGRLCGNTRSRNWTWPGSTTDREPYGVLSHELGHHVDMLYSREKGSYFGDFSKNMMETVNEKPITSYCPNHGEWFAEIFRLYVTNPHLLSELRSASFGFFGHELTFIPSKGWKAQLGTDVPDHIVSNLERKVKDANRKSEKTNSRR